MSKKMKGGWRAGVRRAARKKLTRSRGEMEGGNGMSEANEVTLCLKCAKQNDEAENLLWM